MKDGIQEIEEYYSKFPIDNLNIITSTISPDRKNMLVCYSPGNKYSYCFTYNFDSNSISNNKPVIEQCENKYAFYKLKYFPQTEEYVFICKTKNEKFTIVKFDKNFNKINPDEITNENFEIQYYNSFHSISLAYDKYSNNYIIIADSKSDNYDPLLKTRRFIVTTNFSESFESKLEKPGEFEEIYEHTEFIIDETNKYYVYTKDYIIYANSRDHKKIKINFMDENDLILKTYDNKTINSSLYWMFFKYDLNKGNLVINIEGEEKKIESSQRINNVTELYYYPEFNITSSEFNLVYLLYLKNNTLASVSRRIIIKICKENCSCDESNAYCTGCLEDFVIYNYPQNCIRKDDLFGKFLSNGIYYDCYEMCKSCSQYSEGLPDMKCLSCYIERGDYKEGNNCYEKICENLFYMDKDTGRKICLNITICPKEYPIQKENTKQCIQDSIEDSSIIETQHYLETSKYSEDKDSSKIEESSEISEKLNY